LVILSDSGASCVDAMGLDIRVARRQNEDGSVASWFQLIGYGYGFEVLLGEFALEEQVRDIFNDILAKMRKGVDFYDVQECRRKFEGRRG